MPELRTTGKCTLCGKSYAKAGMGRHLTACAEAHPESLPSDGLLLLVDGGGPYWMYLAVPATASLDDLDAFLRDTWLECCGHLSKFTIAGVHYSGDEGDEFLQFESTDIPIRQVVSPGTAFGHKYDFGSTTRLRLKALAPLHGKRKGKAISVLSRDDPPDIRCGVCGEPATAVCSQCIYDGTGWLCARCAAKHKCGEGMLLPVVNSPRVGVCGYTG